MLEKKLRAHPLWLMSLLGLFLGSSSTVYGQWFYQGRLFHSSSRPLAESNLRVHVRLLWRDASGQSCILYKEYHSINTSQSRGYFSLPLGNGQGIDKVWTEGGIEKVLEIHGTVNCLTESSVSTSNIPREYPFSSGYPWIQLGIQKSYSNGSTETEWFPPERLGSIPLANQAQKSQWAEQAQQAQVAAQAVSASKAMELAAKGTTTGQILRWDGNQWIPSNEYSLEAGGGLEKIGSTLKLQSLHPSPGTSTTASKKIPVIHFDIFGRITEVRERDLVVDWADIQHKPSSFVTQISSETSLLSVQTSNSQVTLGLKTTSQGGLDQAGKLLTLNDDGVLHSSVIGHVPASAISGTVQDSQIASISATKLMGTLDSQRLPIIPLEKLPDMPVNKINGVLPLAKGGTGSSSIASGLVVSDGSQLSSLSPNTVGAISYVSQDSSGQKKWESALPKEVGIVDTSSTQTIGGEKTFQNRLVAGQELAVAGTATFDGTTTFANHVMMSKSLSVQETVSVAQNLAVGTQSSTAQARLHVKGNFFTEAVEIASGGHVDLSQSNVFILKNIGSDTIQLSNMRSGGHYSLIIEDTTPRTYSFSGCGNSYFNPANAITLANSQSIFGITTIQVNGQWRCYIT